MMEPSQKSLHATTATTLRRQPALSAMLGQFSTPASPSYGLSPISRAGIRWKIPAAIDPSQWIDIVS
jgi:hypothetical protein